MMGNNIYKNKTSHRFVKRERSFWSLKKAKQEEEEEEEECFEEDEVNKSSFAAYSLLYLLLCTMWSKKRGPVSSSISTISLYLA
jgi:hypothetical protein